VKASWDELLVKHILDSLAALPVLERLGLPLGRMADLGSGAGLPGIPLAIFLSGSSVTLVERMERRVRFLENQKARLGLSNVRIVQAEAERTPDGPYDLVTFRAFRPFSERKLFLGVTKLVPAGGAIAAYKGRLQTAREELAALAEDPALGPLAARAEVLPLTVPFMDEERCLVILRE
ncbi:MAG: 16S rRNA (guanine(527)-N(7))-methyltransferase RsmG, partial [Treponema sp.]|nr:16S rRNA (guanine(527)-N(7))-methyltransferase RsmG [Treponema sp.]